MRNIILRAFSRSKGLQTAVVFGVIAAFGVLFASEQAEAQSCPCNYNGAVKARTLRDNNMSCHASVSPTIQRDGSISFDEDSRRNTFNSAAVRRNGPGTTWEFGLMEQGFADTFYGPRCFIIKRGKGKSRSETHSVETFEDYEACAQDLSTFAEAQLMQGVDFQPGSCDDLTGDGVVDRFEPLDPKLPKFCVDTPSVSCN